MSKKILKYSVSAVCTLLFAVALFAFTRVKMGFFFDSNDDILLKNIVSGAWTGSPDAHMIYSMYSYGLVFKGLYSLFPLIDWYGGFMIAMYFLCICLIIYRVSTMAEKLSGWITLFVFGVSLVYITEALNVSFMHYTELAALMAATGILWLGTMRGEGKKIPDKIVMVFLFTVSFLMRKEAFFMAVPIIGLVLVFRVISDGEGDLKKSFSSFKRLAVPILIFAVLAGGSAVLEYCSYSAPEWKEFKEYNRVRTEIYDYNNFPEYDRAEEMYSSIGIDRDSYVALLQGDVELLNGMDTKTLNAINEKGIANKLEWEAYYSVSRKFLSTVTAAMLQKNGDFTGLLTEIFFFAVLILSILLKKRLALFLSMAGYLYTWAVTGYFSYVGRFPERVSHGLFLIMVVFYAAILLYLVSFVRKEKEYDKVSVAMTGILAVVILLVSAFYCTRVNLDSYSGKSASASDEQVLFDYISSHDSTYVVSTILTRCLKEDVSAKTSIPKNAVLPGNWTIGSPINLERKLRTMGEESVFDTLAVNPDTFFLADASLDREWLLNSFASKYEGVSLKEVDSFVLPSGMTVSVLSIE